MELDEGNFAIAHSFLMESLALYQAVGERFGAATVLGSLGLVEYYRQDYGRAYTLWEQSLQLRRSIGAKAKLGDSLVLLGMAAARLGDNAKARSLLKEGMAFAREQRTALTIYRALAGFAMLERLQNNIERAAVLVGAADAFREREHLRLSPSHQAEIASELSAARTQLHEHSWNEAWEMGNRMTLEAVVASLITPEGGVDASFPTS